MSIDRVVAYLKSLPHAKISADGTQLSCRCPFCGDSRKDDSHTNFFIKIGVDDREPALYKCFRASCGESGILKTETLQRLGCMDMETILELANHNAKISKTIDKFSPKKKRKLITLNINNEENRKKAAYVNARLGTNMSVPDMKDLKIQLSLYDYLTINHIKKLAFSENKCDLLNRYTIGFISMYEDYIICRDITKKLVTGSRYTMYRAMGVPDPSDTKIYCIPTEIDLTTPEPAVLNIAEGTFSILGAYLHTEIGRDRRNCLFLANCGGGYLSTIKHVCKQYGFLDVEINIFSDSEVGMDVYNKLAKQLKGQINIEAFTVYYNAAAEDFGVPIDRIKIRAATIK